MKHHTYLQSRHSLSYKDMDFFIQLRPLGDGLISSLHRLTEPTTSLSESRRRRAHLLAWLLLFLIVLSTAALFLALFVDAADGPRLSVYGKLILGLKGLFLFAYGLNRARRYFIAAGLTVACATTKRTAIRNASPS